MTTLLNGDTCHVVKSFSIIEPISLSLVKGIKIYDRDVTTLANYQKWLITIKNANLPPLSKCPNEVTPIFNDVV